MEWIYLLLILAFGLAMIVLLIFGIANWCGRCVSGFTEGLDKGYYGVTRKELQAQGMPEPVIELEIDWQRKQACKAVEKHMPVVWIGLMIVFTLIAFAFPLAWPPMIYVWYRFIVAYRQEFK